MVTSTAKRLKPDAKLDDEPAPEATLTPAVFHILLALSDGESHGYGIMQDIDRFTNGEMRLGPGTLYRSIQRMLVDELIEELAIALHDESDDDRRRYYRLTRKGQAVAQREAERLANLVEAARQRHLLGPGAPKRRLRDSGPRKGLKP